MALASALDVYTADIGTEDDFWLLWPYVVDTLVDHGDLATAQRFVDEVAELPPHTLAPLVTAQLPRLRGRVSSAGPRPDLAAAEDDFRAAVGALDAFGAVFHAAQARLSLAEVLVVTERRSEATEHLRTARRAFEGLGAVPWTAKIDDLFSSALSAGPAAAG